MSGRSPFHRARARRTWKTIPLSEVTGQAGLAAEVAADASGAQVAELDENLRRLDSVVNDFIASLDGTGLPAPANGQESENVARFVRILTSAPPSSAHVLGPPVLCGMSPPVHLESVFGILGSLRKTGILRLEADGVTFMISIVRGDVVHGVSSWRPPTELLGHILVERGAIDRYELDRFLASCGNSACRIGEALNRQELVKTEDLRTALEIQLQMLFDRLLAARAAEWCFHEGEATLSYVKLRVNPIRVLLESARKRDESNAA